MRETRGLAKGPGKEGGVQLASGKNFKRVNTLIEPFFLSIKDYAEQLAYTVLSISLDDLMGLILFFTSSLPTRKLRFGESE